MEHRVFARFAPELGNNFSPPVKPPRRGRPVRAPLVEGSPLNGFLLLLSKVFFEPETICGAPRVREPSLFGVTGRGETRGSGCGERGEVRRRVRSDGDVRVGWSTWE